jgi:hypothetical protein
MDASFCIKCFCHITESKALQFVGYEIHSFWSYPWGSGSNDQFGAEVVITGNFLTLRIFVHIIYALFFYGSKMILDGPNHFGRVPIVLDWSNLFLVRSKSFSTGPNYEN